MQPIELAEFGPVIPVIVIHRIEDAVPLARALVEGGVRVLEVTLRTPVALKCMEAIARAVPEAIVGAGTVRSAGDARAAKDAGCQFAVSPGYLSSIGQACRDLALPLLPGVATSSEVMQAQADGHDFLKFFPASAAGGHSAAEGLRGPVHRRGVLPDRRHHARIGAAVSRAAQCQGLRRLVADAARCRGGWATGRASRGWRRRPRRCARSEVERAALSRDRSISSIL